MTILDMFSLTGRVAVVTGAASGLGRAIAEVLSEAGARTFLLDVDGEGVGTAVRAVPNAEARVVDVADRDALRRTVDAIAGDCGRLDVMVANAGISAGPGFATGEGCIDAVEDAVWDRVLAVNLTSVFVTVQAAARHMKPQRSGRIIAIASVAGLKSEALVGYAYAATKAGVVNLVRQSAMELAPYGVTVNGIAPGPFRTNIAGGRIRRPELAEQFRATVPLGRIAEPDEIKGLALLLAAPASSFMTGVTVPVDGGSTAR